MNLQDLLQLGAKTFSTSTLSGNSGTNLNSSDLISALSSLMGEGKNFDIGSLVSSLNSSGLGNIVSSWLGDGGNDAISPEQISETIGPDKIEAFASKLGLSTEEAAGGLSEAIPQMIDNASTGGSILESIGGLEGALGLASKLFGK